LPRTRYERRLNHSGPIWMSEYADSARIQVPRGKFRETEISSSNGQGFPDQLQGSPFSVSGYDKSACILLHVLRAGSCGDPMP
jgi:hypothetical protein